VANTNSVLTVADICKWGRWLVSSSYADIKVYSGWRSKFLPVLFRHPWTSSVYDHWPLYM